MELATVSGALSGKEVLAACAGALPSEHAFLHISLDESGGERRRGPSGAVDAKALMEAAGALQVCPACVAGTLELRDPKATMMVHPHENEWILEILGALPALMPVEQLLRQLLPLVGPAQCVRTQTRALMTIHDAAVLCGAPCSPEWRHAVGAVPLEGALLACVEMWQGFLAQAKAQGLHLQRELASGRYTLAEALRCVGRFGSEALARKAAELVGGGDMPDLSSGPGWRDRFARFAGRRRVCPITSIQSLF